MFVYLALGFGFYLVLDVVNGHFELWGVEGAPSGPILDKKNSILGTNILAPKFIPESALFFALHALPLR